MIYLVTQNKGKVMAANASFSPYDIELSPVGKDFPEIQADTSAEIARFTALQAAREYSAPAIREDHSLVIRHLSIPGPYTQYIEKKISAEKLLLLLKDAPDRSGYFELAAAYAEPDGFVKEFSYTVEVYIKDMEVVSDPRHGWNGLLALKGESRAFTEYSEEERVEVWKKNFDAIAEFLSRR